MAQTGPSRLSIYPILAWLVFVCWLMPPAALAQGGMDRDRISPLNQFSRSIQALAARVSPSVVQVLVTRYGPAEQSSTGASALVTQQENLGSGVIVDPDGYIVTNAHVVAGAQQIRVRLVGKQTQTLPNVVADSYAAPQKARLVGVYKDGDLALIKINATGLPTLSFADYLKLRQGEVVFAFGSPEGLQNSMSMGVVSSIARQLDPDSPFLYVQTDAPINPGDSGGPLVNTAGDIVGLDTFIVSGSGGSEGIGFAIPSIMVHWVYEQLREYGHIHRPVIGAILQTITPTLAAALKLPSNSGVLVSDILPGSPAETAGLRTGDILVSVDGMRLFNVAAMMAVTFQHGADRVMKIEVTRGSQRLSFNVVPQQEPHQVDQLADLADPQTSLIPKLGILAVVLDKQTATLVGGLRRSSGVLVAGRVANPRGVDTGLQTGDAIYEINRTPISTLSTLRSAVRQLQPGDPVALLIERDGKLEYVAFQMQ
jgi:serine protease Do